MDDIKPVKNYVFYSFLSLLVASSGIILSENVKLDNYLTLSFFIFSSYYLCSDYSGFYLLLKKKNWHYYLLFQTIMIIGISIESHNPLFLSWMIYPVIGGYLTSENKNESEAVLNIFSMSLFTFLSFSSFISQEFVTPHNLLIIVGGFLWPIGMIFNLRRVVFRGKKEEHSLVHKFNKHSKDDYLFFDIANHLSGLKNYINRKIALNEDLGVDSLKKIKSDLNLSIIMLCENIERSIDEYNICKKNIKVSKVPEVFDSILENNLPSEFYSIETFFHDFDLKKHQSNIKTSTLVRVLTSLTKKISFLNIKKCQFDFYYCLNHIKIELRNNLLSQTKGHEDLLNNVISMDGEKISDFYSNQFFDSIQNIVEKSGGTVNYELYEDIIVCTIILPHEAIRSESQAA